MLHNSSTQTLFEDEAHLLTSRSVLRLSGTAADALQPLVSCAVGRAPGQSSLGYVLGDDGAVLIDCFILADGDDLLVDCATDLLTELASRVEAEAGHADGIADVTHDWRVLSVLPSQTVVTDGAPFLRLVDPRPSMGVRALRPRSEPESTLWRHELKAYGHCQRLGLLPDARLARTYGLDAVQTHLHLQGVLHDDHISDALKARIAGRQADPRPRLLPYRIETVERRFPTVTGLKICAGQIAVADVLSHHGLYGLALVDLAAWRHATANDLALTCEGMAVTITWPTWCATEGMGRGGPLARRLRAASSDETVF